MRTTKKLFLLYLFGMIGVGANAITFEVDGIAYLGYEGNASVKTRAEGYSGNIIIPSAVEYNGVSYTVKEISGEAFMDCYDLTNVTIPNSLEIIGYKAFYGCSGLTEITIPNSVTVIQGQAFEGSSIKSITIPSSVEIYIGAFAGCPELKSFYVSEQNTAFSSYEGVLYNKDRTTLCCFPGGREGSFSIPDNVIEIKDAAFCGCTKLTGVVIPYSVTTIGGSAFQGCSRLTDIVIPQSVMTIGDAAFSGCNSLLNINADEQNPYYASIEGVLYNKNQKRLVSFPSGRKGSFSIPNFVTSIERYAFYKSYYLENVFIPNAVTYIGDCAFKECVKLASIKIPDSIRYLHSKLFFGCTNLERVIIGNSIEIIEFDVFRNCPSLKNVTCLGTTPPTIDKYTFETYENVSLHVRKGCRTGYANADYWGNFTIFDDINVIETIDADNHTSIINYDLGDNENRTITLLDTYRSLAISTSTSMNQISYERKFGNTEWQSLYVPFEIPLTAELLEEFEFAYINGAKLYDWDDDGTAEDMRIEVFKTQSGTLRANHPYLIRAKATGTKTITISNATLYATEENSIDCSTTELLFTFTGSYQTLGYNDIGGCYLLGGGTWNPVTEGGTMRPMRFYLKIESRGNGQVIPASALSNPIRMTVYGEDGEATEVDAPFILDDSQSGSEDYPYFDLQGRPVENPERGIYIINGKKVFVQ